MRVHIGSDHAGFELKSFLVAELTSAGHDVVDHGAPELDPQDDYPIFCIPAAQAVVADPDSLGIVIGGSGNGEQIAANKVPGCRAALAYDRNTAQLAREHNNAQVIAIGARMHTSAEALDLVSLFLSTPFSGDERHARRIQLMSDFEQNGVISGTTE